MKLPCRALLAALALAALPAFAQISENFTPLSETEILNKLHSIDLTQISMAKLVLARGDNDDARTFAMQMVRDDGEADRWVLDLAQAKGIALAEPAIDLQPLAELSGGPFNRAYMNTMVSAHAEALRYLNHAKAQSSDAALTALLVRFRQVIAAHERLAQTFQSKRTF